MIAWTTAAPALGAAFAASLVEAVEAFTIILAVWHFKGWKPAVSGTGAALLLLAVLVAAFGPLLAHVPLQPLQVVIGVFLLLFGMGWLRKAILRSSGLMALHDEDAIFEKEKHALEESKDKQRTQSWIAGMTAFKAVLLEGLEVVFIVIAVGAGGRGLLLPAAAGAFLAGALVLAAGVFMHKPLSRVPENTLKFCVAVILVSFGLFWTGEGLGIHWPEGDFIIVVFAALMTAVAQGLVKTLKSREVEKTA
ncbi:MAG: hypothetical protein GC185_08410 [Alphaproteobacteria bacterium]|nr:hypothetical protein [Alphaproteobacteria bacterium]